MPSGSIGLDGKLRVIICVVKATTRHRVARTQSGVVEAVRAIAVCLAATGVNGLLVPGGADGLRLRFVAQLNALRVGHIAYTLASLRPGGALHSFAAGGASLADLLYRGRWACTKTLLHILQEGFAALAVSFVPPAAAAVIKGLAELPPKLVEELGQQQGLSARTDRLPAGGATSC